MPDFDFSDFSLVANEEPTGMDAALMPRREVAGHVRKRIASLQELSDFLRVASDTLVHKSERDLWSLSREGDQLVIERLFDDSGAPLKG